MLGVPVRAVQLQRLGDPTAARDKEGDQGAVAELRLVDTGARLGGDPLELIRLEGLGEPPRGASAGRWRRRGRPASTPGDRSGGTTGSPRAGGGSASSGRPPRRPRVIAPGTPRRVAVDAGELLDAGEGPAKVRKPARSSPFHAVAAPVSSLVSNLPGNCSQYPPARRARRPVVAATSSVGTRDRPQPRRNFHHVRCREPALGPKDPA
jgi:hypothetical protein